VCLATKQGRATVFPAAEAPVLRAPGKGLTGIKLREGDEVVAFELARDGHSGPTVVTSFGREVVVRERAFAGGHRGGRGKVVLQRGSIDTWRRAPLLMLGPEGRPAADAPVPPPSDDASPRGETMAEGSEE
jgi:DNA gyrase/topoisomerase IV subunit A